MLTLLLFCQRLATSRYSRILSAFFPTSFSDDHYPCLTVHICLCRSLLSSFDAD